MNTQDIKHIKEFCDNLHSEPDFMEVMEYIEMEETDFEVNNVRFIRTDEIDDVLCEELAHDSYILGCFTASAIAYATGWPKCLIEAAQAGEQFEKIGEAMTGEHVAALASYYVQYDGYGHHFNSYDGNEEELTVGGITYHVFDNR